ncbi:MAG: hypothetical protein L3K18_02585 [Thermoplasmata archaeon]|nr:hypothetical protein [Thermoplasmata archaeon]MCI4356018.1 hypothetical protein [Thermoplasmata archaeon]
MKVRPRPWATISIALAVVLVLLVPSVLVPGAFASPPRAGLPRAHAMAEPATAPVILPPLAARPSTPPSTPCDGPYPEFAGVQPYPAGCFGRDQAVAGFYSNLAGSAGNVTVSLTLPVDRIPTANQSDLYRAIWLGLVLSDPHAWMSQCFLEVRFQPDSSYANSTSATVANNWTGAVVGYAIDPATSTEDACFEQPLSVSGGTAGTYLTPSGGDTLNITTVGWLGSATSEQVTVIDTSTGLRSDVRSISDQGTPLSPAYSTSTTLDAFAAAAAQVPAVSFGVELAGAANPSVVSNSSFGGCSPGGPAPAKVDPAVPCPSYDPTSWVNDTAAPIVLSPPVFSAGATSARAGELRFASTVGGAAGLLSLSNASCTGRSGSAFCTYPWYSYSCGAGGLEFGATDYSGVSTDFGKQNEFAGPATPGLLGFPQFPSNGFAFPACGNGNHNVTVGVTSGTGVVVLLDSNYTTPTSTAIAAGAYAISAVPASGEYFSGWTTTGTVGVGNPNRAATTLVPNGGGSVLATFTSSPLDSPVHFASLGGNASFELGTNGVGPTAVAPLTIGNGSTIDLAAGAYALMVAPSSGLQLGHWTATGAVTLPDNTAPADWLVVFAGGAPGNVSATLLADSGTVTIVAAGNGNGTVVLNGTTLPYFPANDTTMGSLTGPAGSYFAKATAAPGWSFLGWEAAPGAVAIPSGVSGNLTVNVVLGTSYLYATFAANISIRILPPAGGSVSINASVPVGNNTTVALTRGTYSLDAVPAGGYAFQHWRVSDPAAIEVIRPAFPITKLIVNSSATLTAMFGPLPNESVTFDLLPPAGGSMQFNFVNISANTTNASVTNTTYELKAFASTVYRFVGFLTTGPVSYSGGTLSVTGTGGVVTAKFVLRLYPVTFIATRPGAVTLAVNGVNVASGTTLSLTHNVYNLSATVVGSMTTFVQWSSGLQIANVSGSQTSATVRVDAPGTVIGIVATFVLNRLAVSPATVDAGTPTHLTVFVNGSGALTYRYFGLPTGCRSVNSPQLTCSPTSPGTYSVHASVTDSGGAQEATASVLLTVVARPLVGAFTITPATTDAGLAVTISVTPQLGLGPYSYSYAGLPTTCPSVNASRLTCTPAAARTYVIEVTVADAFSNLAYDNATLTVNPQPTVTSLTLDRAEVDVARPTTLTVVAGGGTAPLSYAYSGLPVGCASADAPTLACTPTLAGTSNITVTVTDALGQSSRGMAELEVHPLPTLGVVTVTPSLANLGEAVQISVVGSGGTGWLTYSYAGLPVGCSSANSTMITCTPSATGNWSVTATVADALRASDNASGTVSVQNVPTGPTKTPGHLGGAIDWWYVLLIALVALVVAAVLVWRFGRPPEPADGAASNSA